MESPERILDLLNNLLDDAGEEILDLKEKNKGLLSENAELKERLRALGKPTAYHDVEKYFEDDQP